MEAFIILVGILLLIYPIIQIVKNNRIIKENNQEFVSRETRVYALFNKELRELTEVRLANKGLYVAYSEKDIKLAIIPLASENEESIYILKCNEVIKYELRSGHNTILSSETKKKGVVSRAIVGGAIGGVAGAIIGSATAKEETNTIVDESYYLDIYTVIPFCPLITIVSSTKDLPHRWYAYLNIIMRQNDEIKNEVNKAENSRINTLVKLKNLLDDEIITQEEFLKEKKRILANN